jgi:hypothetical protein
MFGFSSLKSVIILYGFFQNVLTFGEQIATLEIYQKDTVQIVSFFLVGSGK